MTLTAFMHAQESRLRAQLVRTYINWPTPTPLDKHAERLAHRREAERVRMQAHRAHRQRCAEDRRRRFALVPPITHLGD